MVLETGGGRAAAEEELLDGRGDGGALAAVSIKQPPCSVFKPLGSVMMCEGRKRAPLLAACAVVELSRARLVLSLAGFTRKFTIA